MHSIALSWTLHRTAAPSCITAGGATRHLRHSVAERGKKEPDREHDVMGACADRADG